MLIFTLTCGEASSVCEGKACKSESSALTELPAETVTAALSLLFHRDEMTVKAINIMVMTIAAISALLSFKQSSPNSHFVEAKIFSVDFQ